MAPKLILMYKFSLFVFFCCYAFHAAAGNTLNQGDTLNSTETLVSINGLFTLGFYNSENSNSSYLGIWYNNSTTDRPFWLALDTPVDNNSARLTLDATGELKLTDASGSGGSIAKSSTNVTAVLQDSGNFVFKPVNSEEILWQSFDFPTDSFLPGMKLGVNHKTGENWSLTSWLTDSIPTPGAFTLEWDLVNHQLVAKLRGMIFWTSGVLSNNKFENMNFDSSSLSYNFSNVSNAYEDCLMFSPARTEYTPLDLRLFSMLTLNPEGTIHDQSINKRTFSICNGNANDAGCQKWEGQTCRGDGDTFALRRGLFLNMVPRYNDDNASLTLSDCKDLCWKNCTCVGVTINNANGTGCTFWYGPFTEDPTGNAVQYQVIIQDSRPSASGGKKWIWISIAIVVALIVILLGSLFYLRRRRIKQEEKFLEDLMTLDRPSDANEIEIDGNKGHNLNVYNVASIMAATNSFSLENKLGEGGFGPVYKGKLDDGREIAVKRLSRRSGQGLVEFKNELILIAKLQHTNLVRVLGCCIQGEEKMLVYEYLPNKSLDSFIFNESKKGLLDWKKRFSIIEGIAQGLLYLHKYSRLKIIHRDLKVSNILLDENMNPKISDFGMARIFNTNVSEANTNRVVGTYGYMSPEYAMEGIFSVKSDVFSFGVLVLEIVSGRKNHSFIQFDRQLNLVGYAWELWKEGTAIELLDPTLRDSCSKDQVLRCINIGLLCVEDSALDRPTMSDVISMLASEATQLPKPKQPAFSTARSTVEISLRESKTESCSINDLSMSVMDAR